MTRGEAKPGAARKVGSTKADGLPTKVVRVLVELYQLGLIMAQLVKAMN